MSVQFQDFSIQVKGAMEDAVEAFLEEASSEIQSAAARNSRYRSGQLAGSWKYKVDMGAHESQIGSPLENAIWEECGTGEYAAKGNGRKGGWVYVDENGEGHFTRGKKPNRTLEKAFTASKPIVIRIAQRIFKERMN